MPKPHEVDAMRDTAIRLGAPDLIMRLSKGPSQALIAVRAVYRREGLKPWMGVLLAIHNLPLSSLDD